MKRTIGIVGAGVGGLHLALYLQKHGVDATIITDRAPDEYRNSRSAQYRRASSCDDRARDRARHRPLVGSEAVLCLSRPRLQFSAAAALPRRFHEAEPRGRLPDLSADTDGGLRAPRRQDRNSPHRGRRHSRRWSIASICWSSPPARARSANCSPIGPNIRPIRSRSAVCASACTKACDSPIP